MASAAQAGRVSYQLRYPNNMSSTPTMVSLVLRHPIIYMYIVQGPCNSGQSRKCRALSQTPVPTLRI
jgi:hypothetical protein